MNMKDDNNKRVGFHSIETIIKVNPQKIKKLFLPFNRKDKRLNNLIELATENGIKYEISKKLKKDPEAIIKVEQANNFKDLKSYLDRNYQKNLTILIIDNIIDPRNLGSCLRSAAVLEVDAVIINKHQCAPVNQVVHDVSSGGIELLNIFYVSNLINCLKHLQDENIKVFGLSEHADMSYQNCNFENSTAIVMGSEEFGIRKKTAEKCDLLINLSDNRNFKSFNVAVATGIILSEVVRQRKC